FFSSRRRHTRSYGDWSSDVCSSDLSRFVNAIPDRKIRPMQSFTAADVNNVRICRRNRDRADRRRRLIVKNRLPCPAVVGGFKNADRKSTRLNSSHRTISYAVFCLKK